MSPSHVIFRLSLAVLLSMCAAPFAVATDLSNIKTIGIISALGDTLHHVYVGSTAFTNADSSEQVADWKIDDFVIAEFAAGLAGHYEVRPVAYSKSDFYPDPSAFFHAGLDVEERVGKLRPADGSGPDAYIVVTNRSNDDFVGRTNQHLFGTGLYRHHGIFGGNMDAIFASCAVDLVDGRTGKKLDGLVMMTPGGDTLFFPGQPAQRIVKDLWDEHFIVPEQQRLHDEFNAMLHDAVALSLRRLELIQKQ